MRGRERALNNRVQARANKNAQNQNKIWRGGLWFQ